MRFALARKIIPAVMTLLFALAAIGAEVEDAYFGEALFHAHQEQYFEALARLDSEIAQHYGVDERTLDTLYVHIDHAEFSVGDFELRYRMHQRAGRAIRAVLEGDVEESVRNDAAYRLAKIHFQKNQPAEALRVLDQISGDVPASIEAEIPFLRANVYMALHRPEDAVPVLQRLQDARSLKGFSAYNLGIALLQTGQTRRAAEQLDRAGRIRGSEQSSLSIRDKSNLVLGTLMFEAAEYELAQRSLDRVRIAGPFSNQAMLRAGWADATAEKFDRALVPWGILVERESTDTAVQEAMLALPYAYSKLEVHGRAAVLYERAVEFYGAELIRVDASIGHIGQGAFLEALTREEIRQDKDWVIHLRSLPETPETFYLMELMASHAFQSGLQNYLDLEDLRKKLTRWKSSLRAFEEMISIRDRYYEPILPKIDQRFRELDAQMRLRLEQRRSLGQRLEKMLIVEAPELLASSEETMARMRLEEFQTRLEGEEAPGVEATRRRVQRLKGRLLWNLEMKYHERLTEAHTHLRELNEHVEVLESRYESFVRTRQAAVHSYVGYKRPIDGLKARVESALGRVEVLMDQQGQRLERVATEELVIRRERLEKYQNQARFAFADSYDRAAKMQALRDLEQPAAAIAPDDDVISVDESSRRESR